MRHILISEKDANGQVDYAKSKAEADDVYAQLKNGADFEALVKKYSTDTGSKSNGGKYTANRGQSVPEFDEAAFKLKTNEISKPVKTQFGYHIIEPLADTSHAGDVVRGRQGRGQGLAAAGEAQRDDDEVGRGPAEAVRGQGQLRHRLRASGAPGDRRRPRPSNVLRMPLSEALLDLQELTRRLRRDCPWDREQTARTIVPHTVEEAYEVADAALADDPPKLVDELGDLLFQVYFLSLLLEEQGEGDLEAVARAVHEKLVRRHPHVFGDAEARTAGRVRERWEEIKSEQEGREGTFHQLPESLPALTYARKAGRRAATVGFDYPAARGRLRGARGRDRGAAGRCRRSRGRRRPRPRPTSASSRSSATSSTRP